MTLGEIIIQYRKEKNITATQFSRLSTISLPLIYKLEKDTRIKDTVMHPSMSTIRKASRATGIPIEKMLNMLDIKHAEKLEKRKQRRKEENKNYREKHSEMKIYTPIETHERLKKAAKQNGISINKMVVDLIEKELKKDKYKEN